MAFYIIQGIYHLSASKFYNAPELSNISTLKQFKIQALKPILSFIQSIIFTLIPLIFPSFIHSFNNFLIHSFNILSFNNSTPPYQPGAKVNPNTPVLTSLR